MFFGVFFMEEFQAADWIKFVRFWVAISISSGDLSLVFKSIFWSRLSLNFSQFIIPSVRQACLGWGRGWASSVRRTGEWSEHGSSKFFMEFLWRDVIWNIYYKYIQKIGEFSRGCWPIGWISGG